MPWLKKNLQILSRNQQKFRRRLTRNQFYCLNMRRIYLKIIKKLAIFQPKSRILKNISRIIVWFGNWLFKVAKKYNLFRALFDGFYDGSTLGILLRFLWLFHSKTLIGAVAVDFYDLTTTSKRMMSWLHHFLENNH